MAVSIIELSKVAGVSKATVSRVLNGNPRVSQDAVSAVRRAVAELGYEKPTSRVGRPRGSPAGVRKGSIVFLFPDADPASLRTALSGRLLHGVEEALRSRRVNLQLTGLPEPDRLPTTIEQQLVDGVIVRGLPNEPKRRAMLAAAMGTLPCVYLFEPKREVPDHWDIVLEDNDAVAKLAVDYLVARGRRLAVLNPNPEHPSFKHRIRTFTALAQDAGATARVFSAAEPAEKLVARALADGPFDGIFVPGSESEVVPIYRALVANGLRPVDEVGFIGCGNDPSRLDALDPRLANIDIQAEAIGRAAAEMLFSRLQHRKEPQRRMTIAPLLIDSLKQAQVRR